MERQALHILNILIVEDDHVDYDVLNQLLRKSQEWFIEVDWVRTYEEGCENIKQDTHDIYLIDYKLGPKTGYDLLAFARSERVDKPFIVLTNLHNDNVEESLTAVGASDILEKTGLTTQLLERSIRYALRDYATSKKLKSHENELVQIKEKLDQLTEISNQNQPPPLAQVIHANRIPVDTRIDNYVVQHPIGRGGMGTVYLGEHVRLRRKVALKFLVGQLEEYEEVSKRFEREALAVSAINHPNIITIYDVDQWEGTPYIAMEYVDGSSLQSLFEDKKPLPFAVAVNLQYQLARGLLHTHKASIVHRDIKPTNIIVDKNGYLKVLDFGLAKLLDASRITRSEHTLGTAHYVAPEMFLGDEVDFRADIWSAGVMMYQMLTGKKPFGESNLHRVMYAVINKDPKPLQAHDPSFPPAYQHIIDKCLAKKPEDRYHSFRVLINDLIEIARTFDEGVEVLWEGYAASFLGEV